MLRLLASDVLAAFSRQNVIHNAVWLMLIAAFNFVWPTLVGLASGLTWRPLVPLGIAAFLILSALFLLIRDRSTPRRDMNSLIRKRAAEAKRRNEKAKKRLLPLLQHGTGCPAREERIEFYNQVRPDGIEVATVHCLDCGRLHYEHGDAPVSDRVRLPESTAYSERSVAQIIASDREFPDLVIAAKRPMCFGPMESGVVPEEKESLICIPVRITNREFDRVADLTFALAADVEKPFSRRQELSPARDAEKLSSLPDPTKVPTQETVKGDLWFTWSHALDLVYGKDKDEDAVMDEILPRLRLRATDYQSDKAAELNVPGIWRR